MSLPPRRMLLWLCLPLLASCSVTPPEPFVDLRPLFEQHPVKDMADAEFETLVARDMLELRAYRNGLVEVEQGLMTLISELPADAGQVAPPQRRRLKQLWQAFLDHQLALERMKTTYKVFPALSVFAGSEDHWRHARTFGIAFWLHLQQTASAAQIIEAFSGQRDYESILDEADVPLGIPRASFANLKFHMIHVQRLAEIHLLRMHQQSLGGAWSELRGAFPHSPDLWIPEGIERLYAAIAVRDATQTPADFAGNSLDLLKEGLLRLWFPVQKEVSEWMGDTRVTARGPLISPEQIESLRGSMQPGDIIVERRNWYLSNIGLPGFWPHAALYLGSFDQLAGFFEADPEVAAWLTHEGYDSVLGLLQDRHPSLLTAYQQPVHGRPAEVIEAVSEGVIVNSLEHSCAADYVAVLRPRLSKLDRLQALLVACGHWNKPYDFNFDFITDDSIVCSELVYKAYRPDGARAGLPLELQEMLGRKVLPANELVGLFAAQRGQADAVLEFVGYLEGSEEAGTARVGTPEALASSYTRSKWDVQQE